MYGMTGQIFTSVFCWLLSRERTGEKTLISSDVSVRGFSIRCHNAIVSSGRYANFFPVPEEISVRAWKPGRAHVLHETWHCKSSCLFPNITHNFSAPISLKNEIARTTTTVSLAMIRIDFYPCDAAFAACNMTLVSNSSWLHGEREYTDWIMASSAQGFLWTVVSNVVNTTFPSSGQSLLIGTETVWPYLLHCEGSSSSSLEAFITQ